MSTAVRIPAAVIAAAAALLLAAPAALARDCPPAVKAPQAIVLEDILRLNPDLDPQTIQVGQRIRLRQ